MLCTMATTSPPSDDDRVQDLEKGHSIAEQSQNIESPLDRHVSNALTQNWMARLDDDALVSSLTLPGTHDSAAFTQQWPFVATQTLSIRQQLDAGIRYLDLRCGLRNDVAEMVHGPSLLGLRLSEVLNTMYSWLDTHPQEGLIVQIKEDREPEQSTVHFSQAIFTNISLRSERWRTANTTVLLGDLRGKIQLFRRFNGPNLVAYGIDVTQWVDNPSTPFTINTRHGIQLTIQDHYSCTTPKPLPSLIASKGGDVSMLLERAAADTDQGHWYLNFTSASEFNLWYQLTPRQVAVGGYYGFRWEAGMNPRLRNYLLERSGQRHRYGIVVMDFPDIGSDDLVSTLIKTNFKSKPRVWMVVLLFCLFIMLLVALMWYEDTHPEGSAKGLASTILAAVCVASRRLLGA